LNWIELLTSDQKVGGSNPSRHALAEWYSGGARRIDVLISRRVQAYAGAPLPRQVTPTIDVEAMNRRRDEKFMRPALKEAKKALGQTSPNPAVGAVLVVDNQIVAKGHHREAGRDHAEVECLRDFGAPVPAQATLYVTLEPCSTEGRTAPCTDAILQAGIKNVVVGAIDINPRHSGKGIAQLRNAGVNVREGVLADECAHINEAFNKWIMTGRPVVIAKCGMSLDARLIDKVQLYLGPILTGGPVIAFVGRGATNAANALRLRRVSYQRIGQSVCITGYPEVLLSK